MKTKVLLILGGAAWLGIAAGFIINNYANSQHAQALQEAKQTQIQSQVNEQKQMLAQASQKSVQSLQVQVSQNAKDKNEACEALSQVQSELVRYRISLSVPVPKGCR